MYENHKIYQTRFAGRDLVVETGKFAQLANGSALIRYGETVVLATATATESISSRFQWILKSGCMRRAKSPAAFSGGRGALPKRRCSARG